MNIVIVDPSRIALKVLSAAATRRGDKVSAFSNGRDALVHLQTHPDIDLMITNIDPGDMDGRQICRSVRSLRGDRPFPLILATATRPDRSHLTDIVISGADDYVEMPFCETGFLARLRIIERLVIAETGLNHLAGTDRSEASECRLAVHRELARSIRDVSCDIPMSVAIFDIDHLSEINSSFGHPAGDATIRTIDALIASVGGQSSHLGEGRFACIMTGYEPQAALEASADILMSIHQLQLDMNGSPIPVTVSAGLASFYPGEAPEAVLEHAEHALAEAKSAGGGTVQLHQPDDELHALSL